MLGVGATPTRAESFPSQRRIRGGGEAFMERHVEGPNSAVAWPARAVANM